MYKKSEHSDNSVVFILSETFATATYSILTHPLTIRAVELHTLH